MAAQRKPSSPAVPKKPLPEPALDPEAVQALKRGSCPTLSGKSTLHYEVGLDAKETPLFRVTACTGGGFFSKEWVSLPSIRSALQKSKAGATILLFSLFKGKSVNTPGYLGAALRAEKLIQHLPGKTRVGDSVPVFADDEFMEVGVFPAHRDLEHFVEPVERDRFRHLDHAPYGRPYAFQLDA